MKNIITYLVLFISLCGCANRLTREEKVAAERSKEQELSYKSQKIDKRATEIFEKAPGLSDEQKDQLVSIYDKAYEDSMLIRREISQNHSLLYMTLVKSDYNFSEVDKLTKKIIALDKKRMDSMIKSLKDMQKIVGQGSDKSKPLKKLSKK